MQTKKVRPPLPGITHTQIQLPTDIYRLVLLVQEARYRAEGVQTPRSKLFVEAVKDWLKLLDMETGLKKRPKRKRPRRLPRSES